MDTRPVLARFQIVVLRDKGGPTHPKEQMPTAATVVFYRQGATVSEGVTVPGGGGSAIVNVYHRGALDPGDLVQVNALGEFLRVVGPHPANVRQVILETSASQGAVVLAQWNRLVDLTDPPCPAWPTGVPAGASNAISTSSTDGSAACYIPAYRWDYLVIGALVGPRLFIDAEGSFITG